MNAAMVISLSGVLLVGRAAAAASEIPTAPTQVVMNPTGRVRATENWRPGYHFSPLRNWINDPNGLVYFEGEYHLFYQYNPFGDRWGHMSWGHAVSTDLVHWQELPVAIPEDPNYMIFSGSVVVDEYNSSGFGGAGHTPLVAVYTAAQRAPPEIQNQQIAYSLDRGRTWTQYSANPVLDLGLREFRDPKVFWHAPSRRWIMLAVLADKHQVSFFSSPNLKDWQPVGHFGPDGAEDGAWECPDLFELPLQDAPDAPSQSRWVLKVDVFKSAASGSGAQYFVGDFDGRTFRPEPGTSAQIVDHGRDFYAAASWSHLPGGDDRHLWIGWMNNHEYAQQVPTAPWRGAMSVPRSLSLRRRDGLIELVQSPVAELTRLRTHHRRLADMRLVDRVESLRVLPRLSASAEIQVTLRPGDALESGLQIRAGDHQKTLVGYDSSLRQVFIDRTQSGTVDFSDRFPGRQSAALPLRDGQITLHILLDRSSIEVFSDDGARVMTEQIFPSPAGLGLRAYARGGMASFRSFDLWDLESARQP